LQKYTLYIEYKLVLKNLKISKW